MNRNEQILSKWLDLNQVSSLYGFSKSFLYKKVASRQMTHYKPSGRIFFNSEDIEEFIRSAQVQTVTEIRVSCLNRLNLSRPVVKN
jgi:predicted DNA-binding transcriptional regulator AlpA